MLMWQDIFFHLQNKNLTDNRNKNNCPSDAYNLSTNPMFYYK